MGSHGIHTYKNAAFCLLLAGFSSSFSSSALAPLTISSAMAAALAISSAIAAPLTMEASFAYTISDGTFIAPAAVEKPQSVHAITRSAPTRFT